MAALQGEVARSTFKLIQPTEIGWEPHPQLPDVQVAYLVLIPYPCHARPMNKKARIIPVALILAALGGGGWWHLHRPSTDGALTVYGNVDLRQASVPFNGTERIAEVLIEEGDIVRKGQLLARMDMSRLQPQLEQTVAAVEAQKAAVERLHNGSRPEEIAQARANLASAKADAENANAQYLRRKALISISAVSQQDVDVAKATADVALAKVAVEQNALNLAVIVSRVDGSAIRRRPSRGNPVMAIIQVELVDKSCRVSDVDERTPYGVCFVVGRITPFQARSTI